MTRLLAIVLLLGVPLYAAVANDICPYSYIYKNICGTAAGFFCPSGTICMLTGDRGICCVYVKDKSKRSDGCTQPLKIGPCKAAFRRYFYNKNTGQCEPFLWGGCKPNGNNYRSREQCKNACVTVCSQQPTAGSCKDRIQRWYFDAAKCKCRRFLYSGCEGNENRFISKQDCEKSCGDTTCHVCSEPKQEWPCKAAVDRFYYDKQNNECRKFIWGGCNSNGNNFVSLKACERVCKKFVCFLPLKVGPCLGSKIRYYYDVAEGKCKDFLWGGCQSNGNKFGTLKSCERNCI